MIQDQTNTDVSTFIAPKNFEGGKFKSFLQKECRFKAEDQQVRTIRVYDTFDWRLYNQEWVLYQVGDLLYLQNSQEGNSVLRQECSVEPVFVKDLRGGELKEMLGPIIEVRALLKIIEGVKVSKPFRILNKRNKTVLRLEYAEILKDRGRRDGLITAFIGLQPVRGYKSNFSKLETFLENAGFHRGGEFKLLTNAMERSGVKPGDYSTKINIQLEPEQSSSTAVKKILSTLFEVMQRNEAGILEDIDSEFIHDYRVAIRRTRSAFTQLKGVFEPNQTDRFKAEFAKLGELTNSLRDMDVFLINDDSYRDLLPEDIKGGIDPIFESIKQDRLGELERVKQGIQSADYEKFKHDYQGFLSEQEVGASPTAPNAVIPIFRLAQDRIYNRYKRVVRDGKKAQNSADERDMHRLRIECKKLRYLIEFFSSLFPSENISDLLKQLRKLQENLGDFNDLSVQAEHLMSISAGLPTAEGQHTKSLLAVGSLIGILDQQKRKIKDNFSETFEDFSNPQNLMMYKKLFSRKGKTKTR